MFLFRSNDQYNLKKSLPMGARFYLHRNGAGKAMLAEFDDERIRDHIDSTGLPPATGMTITDPDELLQNVETIRERGYARNRGERDSSVQAVSAAIRDDVAGDIGSISISIPNDSPAWKHLDGAYAEAVRQTTSERSLQLKHN